MLWMFQRVNYGPVTNAKNRGLRDLSVARVGRDRARSAPWPIVMGVVPGVFLKPMEPAVRKTRRAHRRHDRRRRNAGAGRPRRSPPTRRPPAPCPAATSPGPRVSLMLQRHHPPSFRCSSSSLAACAVLLAEAFRRPGRLDAGRAGSASSALRRRASSRRSRCGTGTRVGLRRHRRRQLRDLLQRHALRDRPADDSAVVGHGRARSAADGRVLRAACCSRIAGMMLMGSTRDLLVIFLALEIMSLGVYVLTGHQADAARPAPRRRSSTSCSARSRARSSSTASRSPTPSTGTTQARRDRHARRQLGRSSPSILLVLAMVLLLVGFAFKVSAVPFHMWTPDAYQGAPTLVTGFMSTGVKAAAFAAFVRVFLSALEPLRARLGAGAVGDRRPHDDARHGRRRGADERQAHAGVLEHRARRLPARRPGRGERGGKAAILFYLVGLRRDEPRRLRRARRALDRRSAARRRAGLRGPVARAAGPGRAADRVPAVARRIPADRRASSRSGTSSTPPCRRT